MPTRAYAGDAGLDIRSTSYRYDAETDCHIYGTGLAVEIPKNHVGILVLKSRNRKTECYMPSGFGTIDQYRGELEVSVKNRTSHNINSAINDIVNILECTNNRFAKPTPIPNPEEFKPYEVGDAIAQLIVMPCVIEDAIFVDELSETERGDKGHGSSGK